MTSQICARCDKPTTTPVIVGQVHSASGGGRTIYACPKHAARFPAQRDPLTELAALRRARQHGRA
ncbi:hypothetical protein ACWY4P_34540 [Streptomyces sp. LZ34]